MGPRSILDFRTYGRNDSISNRFLFTHESSEFVAMGPVSLH
ncbi:hypothetical protein CaCOL14_013238 [Colletotrichum acutatum]